MNPDAAPRSLASPSPSSLWPAPSRRLRREPKKKRRAPRGRPGRPIYDPDLIGEKAIAGVQKVRHRLRAGASS